MSVVAKEKLKSVAQRARFRIRQGADKTRRHVCDHKNKYGGAVIVLIFIQCIWDISANDISAYFQPVFTYLFGPPPAP